jgi:putative tryptophan/tyrosine transport system substrate-binding protein
MDRRFLLTSMAGAVAAPLAAKAQQGGTKRLGILSIGSPSTPADMAKSPFGARLRELGCVEGNNLSVERRYGKGRMEELATMARDLVRLKADVICASSAVAAAAAKRVTSTVPIVFITLGDPVDQGLIASFAQPGSNITGVAGAQTAGKRLEMLTELVPNLSRVAALVNSTNPATRGIVREMEHAAGARQIQIKVLALETAGDLDSAWSAITASRPNGLVMADDALLFRIRADIRDRAARMKLPVIYGHREDALEGGLAAFSTALAEQFSRAAGYVDRILRGADPGRLPVQRAERFETIINLKTAQALGLTIPPSLLARADQLIE